ncbi:EF-hand domain-containing protein [Alteromonas sp. M12]|uniref:EF-hand domain-containing protein n=1 Tax=Alteromonas sp. M12 TaxID=3135644 RepID=UPI00319DC1C9
MNIMSIGGGGPDPAAREKEKAQQQFDIADTNEDGVVSATEFMAALTAEGVESTKSADMFSNMDSNSDGNLSQQEHDKAVQEREQKMTQMMAQMDGEIGLYGEKDSEKAVNFESFKSMLSSIADDTKDQTTASRLKDLLTELESEGYSKEGVQKSVELMNKVAPPINTTA